MTPWTSQELRKLRLELRVLQEIDEEFGHHVCYCLETGTVAEADTAAECRAIFDSLLIGEIGMAIEDGSLTNLMACPAKAEIWDRWFRLNQRGKIHSDELKIGEVRVLLKRPNAQEVSIGRSQTNQLRATAV